MSELMRERYSERIRSYTVCPSTWCLIVTMSNCLTSLQLLHQQKLHRIVLGCLNPTKFRAIAFSSHKIP